MKLPKQAIVEFCAIYKQKFDVDLEECEAQEKAIDLLRFFKIMTRPNSNYKNTYEYEINSTQKAQ